MRLLFLFVPVMQLRKHVLQLLRDRKPQISGVLQQAQAFIAQVKADDRSAQDRAAADHNQHQEQHLFHHAPEADGTGQGPVLNGAHNAGEIIQRHEHEQGHTNVAKEHVDLSIHAEKAIATAEYTIPEDTKVLDAFQIESIHAELLPSGLYFTTNLTALEGATQEMALDKLMVKIVKENGEDYPIGITLTSGFANLDTWPQIPYTQMITVDQIPETIHLVFPDANGNDTMLVLQLKK